MPHWLKKVIELLEADTHDLRELATIAGGDPATFYRGIELETLELENQDIDGMEFSSSDDFLESMMTGSTINIGVNENLIIETNDLASHIKKIRRQEERISLLLRLVIEHRHVAITVLESYGIDSAKYATLAISELLLALRTKADQTTLVEDEDQLSLLSFPPPPSKRLTDEELAKIVHRTFGSIPPSNRTALLYYLAKHLSAHPEINRFLRTTIERSRSVFVAQDRAQMLGFLDHPSTPSWPSILGISYAEEEDVPVHR